MFRSYHSTPGLSYRGGLTSFKAVERGFGRCPNLASISVELGSKAELSEAEQWLCMQGTATA